MNEDKDPKEEGTENSGLENSDKTAEEKSVESKDAEKQPIDETTPPQTIEKKEDSVENSVENSVEDSEDSTENVKTEDSTVGEEVKPNSVGSAEEETAKNIAEEAKTVEASAEEEVKETNAEVTTSVEQEQAKSDTETNSKVEASKEEDDEEDDGSDLHDEEDDEEDENIDFEGLTLEKAVALGKEQLSEDNIRKADKVIRKLREIVNQYRNKERTAALEKYKAQNNESEEGFEIKPSKIYTEFADTYKKHVTRRKEVYQTLRKERQDNLKAKQAIIQEIKEISNSPDQQGSLAKIKKLQKQWKEIGSVPQIDADNLYRTYNALLDLFYDHKSIEYELKEIDRKKNLEAKEQICEKAENLINHENVNEGLKLLKHLHEEYKAVGPIPREKSDEVWERLKKASDALYDKKREYAEVYKKQLNENMEAKQALCLEVEPFANFDSERIKEWNEKTKELLAIQKKWEAIGPLPREVAKSINKQFWGNFKQFFNNKGKFFERLEAFRKENLEKKEALCEKAEELKDSENWRETAEKLKALQRDWKEVGPVPEAHREKIYQRFKAACDTFFNRKRDQRSSKDKEFKDNLKAKKEICQKIETLADEKSGDEEQLKKLIDEYLSIGYVPKKDINNILEQFISAFEAFYDQYPEEDEEKKEKKKLQAHVDFYKKAPQLGSKMRRQEHAIRKKISALENDIALWENNLAFFATSKTADKLKKEFSARIDQANKKLEDLKSQLDVLSKMT